MTTKSAMDRRQFVISTAVVGGGFALSVLSANEARAQAASNLAIHAQPWVAPAQGAEINPWIVIAPDNTIIVRVNQQEMGQGVFTSNPMMICEELECDWSKVKAVYADANRSVRENKVYMRMATNSSSSVRLGREPYQQAGASARERLKAAAAQQWNAPVAEIEAKNSVLTHKPTGRTLSYGQVAASAAAIKLDKEPAIKTPDQYGTIIGKRVKQLDVELKTYGQATYGIDVTLPNMLYAAVKHSPTYGGKLKSYNFDAIKGRTGVHSAVPLEGLGNASGIAVVADSWWRAKSALDTMPIEWDPGPNANKGSKELFAEYKALLDKPGLVAVDEGNVDAALKNPANKYIESSYETQHLAHATMEPINATAVVTPDRVDLWPSTQDPDNALAAAASTLKIAPEKVFVYNQFLGGGYGGRSTRGHVPQVVSIAKSLNGRPVKLLWSREEDMRNNTYHPMSVARFRAALGADGMPVAAELKVVTNPWTSTSLGFPVGKNKVVMDEQSVRGLHSIPYFIPNLRVEVHNPISIVPTGPMRSTGNWANIFYMESFIDELAHAAGKDPAQYRRALMAAQSADAFEANSKDDWLKSFDRVLQMSEWGKPLPKGMGRGIGLDDRGRPNKRGITVAAVVATVSVSREGAVKVERIDVVHETGFALMNPKTVEMQIHGQIPWAMTESMMAGITLNRGRVVEGNFDDHPIARMADMPKTINVEYMKTNRWIAGVGEEIIPQTAPAIFNAVFAATGKRIRSMPMKDHDLSWT